MGKNDEGNKWRINSVRRNVVIYYKKWVIIAISSVIVIVIKRFSDDHLQEQHNADGHHSGGKNESRESQLQYNSNYSDNQRWNRVQGN